MKFSDETKTEMADKQLKDLYLLLYYYQLYYAPHNTVLGLKIDAIQADIEKRRNRK